MQNLKREGEGEGEKKTLARIRTTTASEGETNSPTPGKNNALHHFCLKDDNLRLGKRTCTKTAPLKLRRSARSELPRQEGATEYLKKKRRY